jgi:hypothetical protein
LTFFYNPLLDSRKKSIEQSRFWSRVSKNEKRKGKQNHNTLIQQRRFAYQKLHCSVSHNAASALGDATADATGDKPKNCWSRKVW